MQYRTKVNLNLYDSSALNRLATQAARGRWLKILSPPPLQLRPLQVGFDERGCMESSQVRVEAGSSLPLSPLEVCLCEDGYSGWLAPEDFAQLEETLEPYQAPVISAEEVRDRIPQVVAFTQAAMAVPNEYLWGGTIAPNYDCSGLLQAAFLSVGVQLPRDAYQQEEFVQAIAITDLLPGDLIFFGTPTKATHVALYLGDDRYIHSSGKDQGRNGIGIDRLSPTGDPVGCAYYAQLRGAGRVIESYQPQARAYGTNEE